MSLTIPAPDEPGPPSEPTTPSQDVASRWRALVTLALFVIALTAYDALLQLADWATNWSVIGSLVGSFVTVANGGRLRLPRRPHRVRLRHAWIAKAAGVLTAYGLIYGFSAAIPAARHSGPIQFVTTVVGAVIGLYVFIAATHLPARANQDGNDRTALINPLPAQLTRRRAHRFAPNDSTVTACPRHADQCVPGLL